MIRSVWAVIPLVLISLTLSMGPVPDLAAEPLTPSSTTKSKERASLFQESERAQSFVAWLSGASTEGAGIVIQVTDGFAWGMTAAHVVYNQGRVVTELEAQFSAWPGHRFKVEATNFDLDLDLAVFRADLRSLGQTRAELLQSLPLDQLGASVTLDPGDELFTVGHSTAGAWLVSKRPARFSRTEGQSAFLFEYDCPRGHSGGGVFDRDWALVGMIIQSEQPYCRALRVEKVLSTIQRWKVNIGLTKLPKRQKSHSLDTSITVAVVDFDNRSGKPMPNLAGLAQDVTTSYLVPVPGVRLVSRSRLNSVRDEIGLTDSASSTQGLSRAGRLLDADAILTGSILRYDVERRVFEGYGTSALKDSYRMGISLQVIDVDTARVRFAENFNVERVRTYPKASSAPRQPIELASKLLESLLEQAENPIKQALAQVAAGLGAAGQFVEVPVTTRPAGADVILNNIYMGSTPLTLKLTLDSHEIALELPGYVSWRRRIKVEPGRPIEVNLQPKTH